MTNRLTSVITGVLLLGAAVPASGQTLSPSASGQLERSPEHGSVRRLGVDEAVRLALEQNLSIRIERLNPQLQDLSVALARTAWTPNLTAAVEDGGSVEPTSNIFAGALDQLRRDQAAATVEWGQLLPWGATYAIAWRNSRVWSNSLFDNPNPALSSTLAVSYVQPLLRNFRIDGVRQQLQVSRARRDLSDIELTETVLRTVRSVKTAYWELAHAASSLEVQRQSRDLAEASLRISRSRLQAGMMAPLDVVEAESEVARREEAVIVAAAALAAAEDRLRALIFDPATPEFWDVKLQPTDAASVRPIVVDAAAAVRAALDQRTDLRAARKELDVADIDIRYFQNQTLPDVRVQVDHGLSGQGGTTLQFGPGFPPAAAGRQNVGYGTALRNLIDNGSWRVSLSVAYPVGASAAEVSLARTKVQRMQAQTRIRNLELQVATDVRDAARQVTMNAKRIEATAVARRLAERRLEAEEKKLAAGLSTSFLVFQAQRDLAQARHAELRAILDFNTSVVEFEVIQQAPASSRPRT